MSGKKTQFQCLEKPKYTIPMFEKSPNPEFQYLEKPRYLEKLKSRIPCLEMTLESRIPMFGKAKVQNSDYPDITIHNFVLTSF